MTFCLHILRNREEEDLGSPFNLVRLIFLSNCFPRQDQRNSLVFGSDWFCSAGEIQGKC